MQDRHSAFVSYSRQNSEFVLRLIKDLRAAGADVWMDLVDIQPGQLWDHAIETALKTCATQLIVLSPEAVKSENVMDEVSFGLDQRKKIIPILCQDCEIPFRLRRLQYIDFRKDYRKGLEELLSAMAVGRPLQPLQSGVAAPATDSPDKPASVAAKDAPKKKWLALSGGAVLLCAVLVFAVFYIQRVTGDASIVRELNEHLKNDSGIVSNQITFTSSGRNVILTGTVYSQAEKDEAGEFAHHHLGDTIKSITNNIQVLPPYVVPEEQFLETGEKIGLYRPGDNLTWVRNSGDEYQFLPAVTGRQKVKFVKTNPPYGWVQYLQRIERYGKSWDDFAMIKLKITWDDGAGVTYREFRLSQNKKSLSDCVEHEPDGSVKNCDGFSVK